MATTAVRQPRREADALTDINEFAAMDSSICASNCKAKSPVMTVSIHEEMNPSRRSTMEDAIVVHEPGQWSAPDPDLAYLAIYDGHGGRAMVEYLEHGLSFHVAQELSHNDDATMETRLERAFLMADCHAAQCGVTTSGATVIVCLVKKIPQTNQTIIYSANAGDARAVLGHQGTAQRLSRDHRVDDPMEAERIDKAGGFLFKGRVLGVLAVSRSLGDHCMKDFVIARPYYNVITIENYNPQPGYHSTNLPNVLILACDGFWDVVEDQEAVSMVLQHEHNRTDVAQMLVTEAVRRGSTDNISVVVAWL